MVPTDSALTLNFNLDVQHTLKVDIPPGGEKVQLVPAGGWQSWLQAGRKPVRLFRDQTFNISASSRFKMYMECERDSVIYDCQLADRVSRRGVELQVFVSLPNGLTDMSGRPVRHMRCKRARPMRCISSRASTSTGRRVSCTSKYRRDRCNHAVARCGSLLPGQGHRDLGFGNLMGRLSMGRACVVFTVMRFKSMKRLWLLLGLSGFSLAVQAGPQINVGTVYDYLDGDKSTYLKRVFNSGDSTAFVKVNILKLSTTPMAVTVRYRSQPSGWQRPRWLDGQPRAADRAGQRHAGHAFAAHGRT
jgi:hypothetical protein